jgi:pimeloyl-ACP methyl ester carboxylesterase
MHARLSGARLPEHAASDPVRDRGIRRAGPGKTPAWTGPSAGWAPAALLPTVMDMKYIPLAAAAAGLLAAALVPATMGTASAVPAPRQASAVEVPSQSGPPVPVLDWHSCDGGFQCATARAPLDYRHPGGTKVSIAVIRHQATDPARRLGKLFVNYGGPEEQIEPFVSGFTSLPAQLRARYDIITFDPRGFGFSTSVRCFSSVTAENSFLASLPPFPVGAQQDAAWERTYAQFDAQCIQRNGSLLGHVTTADAARDMNLLRQAVGAPRLNYLGASYGTLLGAIYANLFPATTGHMVFDGAVDPVAWTSPAGMLPSSIRAGKDLATAAALHSYLDLCGQEPVSACAFSAGAPAATEAKFATLEKILQQHPVNFGAPPQAITYADLLTSIPLGNPDQWQGAAVLLQQLWAGATSPSGTAASPAAPAPAPTDAASTAPADASGGVYTGADQAYAVSCSDESDPRSVSDYAAAARLAGARAGGYGLFWAWQEEACAHWPTAVPDQYTGPWNRRTATTILVMSLTGDPVTPYQNGVAMTHDLASARLLTIDGFGHTELLNGNPSACAAHYEVSYLTTGALPTADAVCSQNPPFPALSS